MKKNPRSIVINHLLGIQRLKFGDDPWYIEIGVRNGETFKQVNTPNKLGVDPDPKFRVPILCHSTSAEFFRTFDACADVIFIDGSHTYEDVYQDILFGSSILRNNGWLVLHDVWPISGESVDNRPPNDGTAWCGQAWRAFRNWAQFARKAFLVTEDHGIGVLSMVDKARLPRPKDGILSPDPYMDLFKWCNNPAGQAKNPGLRCFQNAHHFTWEVTR